MKRIAMVIFLVSTQLVFCLTPDALSMAKMWKNSVKA